MTIKNSEKEPKKDTGKEKGKKAEELHTDFPMSEKDEVKEAERNTQKQQDSSR